MINPGSRVVSSMTLQASTESATPILIETAKQSPQKQQLRKDSGQEKKNFRKKWLQIRDALKLAHFKIAFPEATNIFSPGTRRRRPNEAHNQSSGSNNVNNNHPHSTSPSAVQRQSSNEWTFAFDRVITDDEGRNEFTKFLQSEYSEENILFWWAVQELRLCVEDRTAFERMVREMFETFIATDSPLAINIDHDTRTEIIERVQLMDAASVPNTIFDKAQSQIYRLMEKDCFSRFVHTQAYKDLARRLSLPHTFRFNERLSPF